MKICVKCNIPKSETDFYGHKRECKQCILEKNSASRQALGCRSRKLEEEERLALSAQGLKRCRGCDTVKSLGEFSSDISYKDGIYYLCFPCKRQKEMRWRTDNPDKVRKRNHSWVERFPDYHRDNKRNRLEEFKRRDWLKFKYNMELELYMEIYNFQNGLCSICLKPERRKSKKWLSVDHDHACCPESRSCGKCIRGLICYKCNSALSNIDDDPIVAERLAIYLRNNLANDTR